MKTFSLRTTYFISFILVMSLIGTTLYLQKYSGFVPCPLCILQRIVFAMLGVIFFFGALAAAKKVKQLFIGIAASLVSLLGIVLSGRQVWLQHLPPNENVDCGASLQYLLHVLPWDEVLKKIFQGTAECTLKGSEFFHLSLAEWSLICFILFLILSLAQTSRSWGLSQ